MLRLQIPILRITQVLGILNAFLAAVLCCVHPAAGQSSLNWRFYTSVDGLRESYSRAVSVGPSGKVWVNHGRVDHMSVLDGYTCRQLPTPGPNLKVKEAPDGTIWAYKGFNWPIVLTGLQRFSAEESRWMTWDIPAIKESGLSDSGNFEPLDKNRALFLLPDSLMQFDAESKVVSVVQGRTALGRLLHLTSASDGGIWVGAQRGLGKYGPGQSTRWQEFNLPADFHNLTSLLDQAMGDIIGTAQEVKSGLQVVLSFRDGKWQVLYRAGSVSESIRGWRSKEGGTWVSRSVAERFSLLRLLESGVQEETKNKVSSGSLLDVATELDGTFWIATSFGLAHYAPFTWRSPAPISDLTENVTSIVETKGGRLYFLFDRHLVLLDGESWKRFELPDGHYVPNRKSNGMAALADGRLVIPSDSPDLLLFDPVAERFEYVKHPKGEPAGVIRPAKGGAVWISAPSTEGLDYRLETFDGHEFHPRLAMRAGDITLTRDVCETSSGDLWIVGNGGDGVGIFRNGQYQPLRKADGFIWGGGFVAIERPDGQMWLGDRAGVLGFDGKHWSLLHADTETVRSMIPGHDGSVWIASGSGIHRYYDGSWFGIRMSDGLPDASAMAVFQDSKHRIWVGTTNGLSLYYPEADQEPPQTFISEDKNLRRAPPGGEVHLVFSGMDHWRQTVEERLLYSYRIDGKQWSPYLSEEMATFRGLSSGAHVFEVRAMDRNWNADPVPSRFEFTVLRPWYRENAFLALASVGALAILVLVGTHMSRHFQLGRLVAARTSELTAANEQLRQDMAERERAARERERLEERLRQSQKMEALGRLSGGIAHDFNNLLTVINGYASMIIASIDESLELRPMADEIAKAGERAAALVRQLLAFSRKQVLEPKVLDLNAAVRDMEQMLRSLIGEDIRLETTLGPALALIRADSGQVQQVLMNLAVNARDAMPQGGKLIIRTENVDVDHAAASLLPGLVPGPHVALTVTDTGPGMDAETQSRIFEPFFTTKEPGRGTGLGLSTVYGIVEQSGGAISVSSRPGEGATFGIYFPRIEGTLQPAVSPSTADRNLDGSETILLVEDQPEVRRLASRTLRAKGFRILEAASGEEALEIEQSLDEPIHLLMTDAVMPGMSGRQLVERLKIRRPETKVLIISGYSDELSGASFSSGDAVAYLPKPFTPAALAAKVRAVLEG